MKTKDVEKKLKEIGFDFDFTAKATIHFAGGKDGWATVTENGISIFKRNPIKIAQEAWDKESIKNGKGKNRKS